MNARSGLSLFELLIALALLAMLSAGLAGALGMAVKIQSRASTAPQASMDAALRIRLRNWLAAAVSPDVLAPYPTDIVALPDRLEFTTTYGMEFAPDAAALRVTVAMSDDPASVTVASLGDDGNVLDARVYSALFLGSASLQYQTEPDGPWQNGADKMPILMRVQHSGFGQDVVFRIN